MIDDLFHPLHTSVLPPCELNSPFRYEPHPLCLLAADEVRRCLRHHPEWDAEVAQGKMFGVLVCSDGQGRLGFLAAYSGQLQGRADWPWFVPAVFDYLQPDGYFRQEEACISDINRQVAALEHSAARTALLDRCRQLREQADREVSDFQAMMRQAKLRRDALRGTGCDEALTRESQFQKAELRRLKHRWADAVAAAEAQLQPVEARLSSLRQERKRRSDSLQLWLFDRFLMLNAQGQCRSLSDIFRPTPQGVPPSGSGECCAPRLLQYAFGHGLRPLCMAEFWQGQSPRLELRRHDHFYGACSGKCKPILEWMLGGAVKGDEPAPAADVRVVYADADVLVVDKPSGLLSVPGKGGSPSVESLLRERYGAVFMAHRLDQDTSGLMVVARTLSAYHHLQRQFLARNINKVYVALLERAPLLPQGTVSLPLRPDPLDRPRQVVDADEGKPAVTDYRVLDGRLVELRPHTGRTHQLRVHCAHPAGLDAPIVGDSLYGRSGACLCLHASQLSFVHPVTGRLMTFRSEQAF